MSEILRGDEGAVAGCRLEATLFGSLFAAADQKGGMAALLQKSRASFQGR